MKCVAYLIVFIIGISGFCLLGCGTQGSGQSDDAGSYETFAANGLEPSNRPTENAGPILDPQVEGDHTELAMILDIHLGAGCRHTGIRACASDCNLDIFTLFPQFLQGEATSEAVYNSCRWTYCNVDVATPIQLFDTIQSYQWTFECETIDTNPDPEIDELIHQCSLEPADKNTCFNIQNDLIH